MRVSTGASAFFSAARISTSCSGEKTLMWTSSLSASNLARFAQSAGMVSNASGKLMPSGRGHVSQVASWRAHSAGIRKPREAGEFLTELTEFGGTEFTEFFLEGWKHYQIS